MNPGPIRFAIAIAASALLASTAPSQPGAGTRSFLSDTGRAMTIMHAAMMTKPTGDVDRDFVAMMVPHHQGAIDMAIAEIRYGRDIRLKRIAQEIIVDQQQEIAAMRLALDQPLPASAPAQTQPMPVGADRVARTAQER